MEKPVIRDITRGGERKRGFRMLLRPTHVEIRLAICGVSLTTGKGGQK